MTEEPAPERDCAAVALSATLAGMAGYSHYLWVAVGSALGGVGRFALSQVLAQRWGETFPWGTLVVNVSGSFAIGCIATLIVSEERFFGTAAGRYFLMTGVLGGYTTYSSFSLQTLVLAREGAWLRAAANAGGTVVLCFLAVWLGYLLANWLNAARAG